IGCGANFTPQATQKRASAALRAKHSGHTKFPGPPLHAISAPQYSQLRAPSRATAPHDEQRCTGRSTPSRAAVEIFAPQRHAISFASTFVTSYWAWHCEHATRRKGTPRFIDEKSTQ